jgi:hypothetical protein
MAPGSCRWHRVELSHDTSDAAPLVIWKYGRQADIARREIVRGDAQEWGSIRRVDCRRSASKFFNGENRDGLLRGDRQFDCPHARNQNILLSLGGFR